MNTEHFEPKFPTNFQAKSQGQIRGMIIVLRGMVREEIALLEYFYPSNRSFAYYHLVDANRDLSAIDSGNVDFDVMWHVIKALHNAVYHRRSLQKILDCALEIVADVPIPFVVNDVVSPFGDIAWKVDGCANHRKGGWFTDADGKQRFLMPPYPGVDDICPKCGGYLPQKRGGK